MTGDSPLLADSGHGHPRGKPPKPVANSAAARTSNYVLRRELTNKLKRHLHRGELPARDAMALKQHSHRLA